MRAVRAKCKSMAVTTPSTQQVKIFRSIWKHCRMQHAGNMQGQTQSSHCRCRMRLVLSVHLVTRV